MARRPAHRPVGPRAHWAHRICTHAAGCSWALEMGGWGCGLAESLVGVLPFGVNQIPTSCAGV
eukprot:2303507-Pyramimonas_sp.AAC.1